VTGTKRVPPTNPARVVGERAGSRRVLAELQRARELLLGELQRARRLDVQLLPLEHVDQLDLQSEQ
jgi:hypothetical protein